MLLLALAACIETGINSAEKPVFDDGDRPGDTDTAPPDTDDTGADTDVDDTGDTVVTDTDTGAPPDTDTAAPPDTAVDTEPPPDTAVDTGTSEPPGPVAVRGFCSSGYAWTGWSDASATEPELHIVGVYESEFGAGGAVTVAVPRTAEMVLVLSTYSGVDWQVELPAATNVREIVVNSAEPAAVTFTGAGTAPVTYAGWLGSCGYEWPDVSVSGCETPELQTDVEAYTALTMSSFQGCYSGGEFVVDN